MGKINNNELDKDVKLQQYEIFNELHEMKYLIFLQWQLRQELTFIEITPAFFPIVPCIFLTQDMHVIPSIPIVTIALSSTMSSASNPMSSMVDLE